MKRLISIILVVLILTFNVNSTYCKASEVVVEPVVSWTVEAIFTALFALVGVSVDTPAEIPDTEEKRFFAKGKYDDQINMLADEFGKYITTKYNATAQEVDRLAKEMDSYLTAKVNGVITVSSDMYKCLKSFVSDIMSEESFGDGTFDIPVNIAQYEYSQLCNLNNVEFRSIDAQLFDEYFNHFNNIVTYVAYDVKYTSDITFDRVVMFASLEGAGPDYGFVVKGDKVEEYRKLIGSTPSDIYSLRRSFKLCYKDGVINRRLTSYNGDMIVNSTTPYKLTSISKTGTNVYASVLDLYESIPVENRINGKYKDINLSIGLDTLRERYGNLDNLDSYVNDGSVTAEGVILDIPGNAVMEKIKIGEIAIDDAIPVTLVDTIDGVIIDDSYAKDDAEPIPYVPVNVGELSTYLPTADLTTIFPFCIPFDLVKLIRIFNKPAFAPKWEINFEKSFFGVDYTFVIDMSKFDSLARIFRLLETALFIFGLIMVTRNLIKG